MTYVPGGGSGGGSVSTSSDVALNNPLDGNALTYNASIAKWVNQSLDAKYVLLSDYNAKISDHESRIKALEDEPDGGPESAPPTAPGAPVVTINEGVNVSLSWTASTDDGLIQRYTLERSVDGGVTYTELSNIIPPLVGYEDNGLASNTTYYYRVYAVDNEGQFSPLSGSVSATTTTPPSGADTTPPPTPEAPTVNVVSDTSLSLSWTAVVDNGGSGMNGYRVERSLDSTNWSYLTFVGNGGTSYADTGLTLGTTYYYRLRAKDIAGNMSEFSAAGSATTSGGGGTGGSFTLIFSDMMTKLDTTNWGLYNGAKQLNAQGPRWKGNVYHQTDSDGTNYVRIAVAPVPNDVTLSDGYIIKQGEWAAGGMSLRQAHQMYGAYEMKVRATWPSDQTQTTGTRLACLLWPEVGWPPELDWFEAGKEYPTRQAMKISNWYINSAGVKDHKSWEIKKDYTQWHIFRVEWTKGLYLLKIDGVEVWRTTAYVPEQKMWLGFQTAISGGKDEQDPNISRGFVDVAWVKVYRPN